MHPVRSGSCFLYVRTIAHSYVWNYFTILCHVTSFLITFPALLRVLLRVRLTHQIQRDGRHELLPGELPKLRAVVFDVMVLVLGVRAHARGNVESPEEQCVPPLDSFLLGGVVLLKLVALVRATPCSC